MRLEFSLKIPSLGRLIACSMSVLIITLFTVDMLSHFNSLKIDLIQIASRTAKEIFTFPDSAVDCATIVFFFDLQDIADLLSKNTNLLTDFRSIISFAKSKSL